MEFYKVLLQIMEDRSLSIPDIARSCGLSDSTIRSVINRKQKSVALDVAFKISSGLQVDLEYLNTGKHTAGGECVHTPEPQLVLNSEEADVVKNYMKCSTGAASLSNKDAAPVLHFIFTR